MAKGNMKTIKRRVKSVGSTLKITKAMEMVASSKLRRAKQRAEAIRPYFESLYGLLAEIACENCEFSTVFTKKRAEIKNRLFIVIAGDRGLAGGYNSNILKKAVNAAKNGVTPKIIAVGKKAIDFFAKRKDEGYEKISDYPDFSENVKVSCCAEIADTATEMFRSGEIDEVRLFYTSFVSALAQEPEELLLLPLEGIKEERRCVNAATRATYDPSPEAVFDRIIPKFILSAIGCACVDAYASEQCARRIAMENASDNAEEMIASLALQYNRARQEKITNEINEIVAGANAI